MCFHYHISSLVSASFAIVTYFLGLSTFNNIQMMSGEEVRGDIVLLQNVQ